MILSDLDMDKLAGKIGFQIANVTPHIELRDYLAGQALAGIIAREGTGKTSGVKEAYEWADAMLKARHGGGE